MKTFKFILKRINSFLCDLALAYALFYLLLFVRPIGFPISAYFFCSVILCFGLSYWIFRASFMQKLFGIVITKRYLNYLIFKLLWIAIIPLALSVFHYDIFLILYVLIMLVLSIILLPFIKESLWQWCSGAQVELQKEPYKNKSHVIILLVVIIALIFFPLFRSNFRLNIAEFIQNNKNAVFPISIPEKAYYVKNIRQYKEDPANYVMQLFDKYDIVILSESAHSECTQWEFFSEIILNDTFASNVKNVFTELGNAMEQERLDTYMNTHFSEEDLQRATAAVARESAIWPVWSNTNIYNFILRLHQYNEMKDSLNRIDLFFTDSTIDWNKVKNPVEYDSILTHSNRDSIMAYHIINRYETQHLNKCLIITNTRHAWKYRKKNMENEATYIFEKFPDKTAVVWTNFSSQLFYYPAMNGSLDAAALEVPDSIWAIDFNTCPLGNTHFDLFPTFKFSYKDFFVGMVYYKHPSNWNFSENYPFILDDYEDTLLKRSALLGDSHLKRQKDLMEKGYYDTINRGKYPIFALTNLLFLSIHSIILLFLFLNLLIKLFIRRHIK